MYVTLSITFDGAWAKENHCNVAFSFVLYSVVLLVVHIFRRTKGFAMASGFRVQSHIACAKVYSEVLFSL